jgi:4-amino-4-deoxy-L-arabinose transferase-like glycosyltransferase
MKRIDALFLGILIFVCLGFGLFKLTESPPTWSDEGMIAQLAMNLATHGTYGLQVAPNTFESGAYISVGFPLLFPMAGAFSLFGTNLAVARSVMVVFMVLFAVLVYLYVQREQGSLLAFFSGLLVVTFPSFYGDGKSVMGEVPGLVFLVALLLCMRKLEHEKIFKFQHWYAVAGLLLGLVLVTKPVFLPLLGAVGIAYIWSVYRGELPHFTGKQYLLGFLGFLLPMIVWLSSQFFVNDSFVNVLRFYMNPYGLDNVLEVMLHNISRFFTESSPLYMALLGFIWFVSVGIRERSKLHIGFAERTAFIFFTLVLVFYLRTPGWYKYFFIPEMLALLFFPSALYNIFKNMQFTRALSRHYTYAVVAALISLQLYMLLFTSWIAQTYTSTRSADLLGYFSALESPSSVLIFNAPEIVFFLPDDFLYYQYLSINEAKRYGDLALKNISKKSTPKYVVIPIADNGSYKNDLFPGYHLKETVGRYAVLLRKE